MSRPVESVVITMCRVCDAAVLFCTCAVQFCIQVYIQVIPVSDCFLTNFHFHVGNRDAVRLHEPFHQKLMLIQLKLPSDSFVCHVTHPTFKLTQEQAVHLLRQSHLSCHDSPIGQIV